MLLSMWLSVGLKAKKMPFSLLSAACVPARQDKKRHAKSAQCHPRDTRPPQQPQSATPLTLNCLPGTQAQSHGRGTGRIRMQDSIQALHGVPRYDERTPSWRLRVFAGVPAHSTWH